MPQVWSAPDDDSDGADAWLVRRNARVALRSQADAVARDLWNQATQHGADLYAGNPSDLTAIGLASLAGAEPYPLTTANDDGQGGYGADRPPSTDGGSPITRVQDQSRGALRPSGAYVPTVSEVDVVAPRPAPPSHAGIFDILNHNLAARVASGVAGYAIGLPLGALRGG